MRKTRSNEASCSTPTCVATRNGEKQVLAQERNQQIIPKQPKPKVQEPVETREVAKIEEPSPFSRRVLFDVMDQALQEHGRRYGVNICLDINQMNVWVNQE